MRSRRNLRVPTHTASQRRDPNNEQASKLRQQGLASKTVRQPGQQSFNVCAKSSTLGGRQQGCID